MSASGQALVVDFVRRPVGVPWNDITEAERSAGVTPTNYAIPSHEQIGYFIPNRYGTNATPGTTDMTTAVQTACDVAGQNGGRVQLLPQTYLCSSNIEVPVGDGRTVDVIGTGWANNGLLFSGAAVTKGLAYTGSALEYAGSVEDLRIRSQTGAKRCYTATNVNHPRVVRSLLRGAAGAGALFDDTLMGLLAHTTLTGCGSATEGSVEVQGTTGTSTTWKWDHSRISSAHASSAVGGLIINRTVGVTVEGGAIESCGKLIRVGHRAETVFSCVTGHIQDIDLENPGNGNPYIELGAGMSVDAFVQGWLIESIHCTGSGTTDMDNAFAIMRGNGVEFRATHFTIPGTPDACFAITGDTRGVVIGPHRHLATLAFPWVSITGAQVKAAGPRAEWNQEECPRGVVTRDSTPNLTGATPSILQSATMGGYYGRVTMTNVGATTVTSLSDGELGMEIEVFATNGNTTLTHGTGSGQFFCVGAANLTLIANLVYRFRHSGTYWAQVTG